MSNTDDILREMHDTYFKNWQPHCPSGHCPFNDTLRPFVERLASAKSEPQAIELVKQLRDALGLDNGARPESPQVVWEETLNKVRGLVAAHKKVCREMNDGTDERARLREHGHYQAERIERAEAESQRLREAALLPRSPLGETLRELRASHTLDMGQRIDRLEQLWTQVDKARQMGRGCPACCMVGEDASNNAFHDSRCLVAEISREVAQR